MKSKKNRIMVIAIIVLAIAVVVMGGIIWKIQRGNGSAGTADSGADTEAEADVDKSTDVASDSTTEQKEDRTADDDDRQESEFYAVIGHDNTWEADGKACATENIDIYNKSASNVSEWKLEIIYKGKPEIDQIWNAKDKIKDNTVTLTAMDYNEEIAAGQSINLGYNISSDDLEIEDYILYIDGTEYRGSDITPASSSAKKKTEKSEDADDKKVSTGGTKKTGNAAAEKGSPFANHGVLSVKNTDIIDKNGDRYQLKGVSTHGITWFPDYVNKDAFATLRDEWGANLIRLAMYTDTGDGYGYCSGGDKNKIMDLVDTGVSAASELGMYVIIDWHILNDSDPNTHIEDAKEFFEEVSARYAGKGNVIYEICNEPNGGTDWSSIKKYAETIIPIIRDNDKKAIIIVGTPTWSQDVDIAADDPVAGYDNIMYAVHFYAATHKDDIRNKVKTALSKGLPVFVSEFSLCDASGNGGIDYDSSDAWFELINDNNLSYSSWSLCNKAETSALLSPSSSNTGSFTDDDLSETGRYIRDRIQGN